jgi:hypothetical protein
MSKVKEIKEAIESLPAQEYKELLRWLTEKDWEKWDQQIEEDSKSGKLDFLVKQAKEAKAKNKLREL